VELSASQARAVTPRSVCTKVVPTTTSGRSSTHRPRRRAAVARRVLALQEAAGNAEDNSNPVRPECRLVEGSNLDRSSLDRTDVVRRDRAAETSRIRSELSRAADAKSTTFRRWTSA
jgi:hypothetical protein